MTPQPTAPVAPLLTFAQAAERLAMSETWLRHKVADRAVQFTQFGRSVRFSEADLAEIVAAGRRQPATDHLRPRLVPQRRTRTG